MSQFRVHFFKEKNQVIDIESVFSFFSHELGFVVDSNDQFAQFIFEHQTLHLKCLFMITPKTTVPDIYRLSPKYLDVNIHFEMPVITSHYMADKFFKFIEAFSKRFHLYIYHPLFEDVLSYHYDVLLQVFQLVKHASIKKDMSLLDTFEVVDATTLFHMYKYMDDVTELKHFYQGESVDVTTYDTSLCDDELLIGVHIHAHKSTVIPPYVNVLYYHYGEHVKMIDFNQVKASIEKLLIKVPGTIEGTKMITKKMLTKVNRLLKKAHEKQLSCEIHPILVRQLMDVES
jgi:hypothetical protein